MEGCGKEGRFWERTYLAVWKVSVLVIRPMILVSAEVWYACCSDWSVVDGVEEGKEGGSACGDLRGKVRDEASTNPSGGDSPGDGGDGGSEEGHGLRGEGVFEE